jgi:hypothetical protein
MHLLQFVKEMFKRAFGVQVSWDFPPGLGLCGEVKKEGIFQVVYGDGGQLLKRSKDLLGCPVSFICALEFLIRKGR